MDNVRLGLRATRSICGGLLRIPEEKGLRMDRKLAPGIFFRPSSATQPSPVSSFKRVDSSDDGEARGSIAGTKMDNEKYVGQKKVFMSVSHPTRLRTLDAIKVQTACTCTLGRQRWRLEAMTTASVAGWVKAGGTRPAQQVTACEAVSLASCTVVRPCSHSSRLASRSVPQYQFRADMNRRAF